jgi:hypothetical protein
MKALFKLPPLRCVRQSRIVPEKLYANGIWFLIAKHRTEHDVVHWKMNLAYLFGLQDGLLVLALGADKLFLWTRISNAVVIMATEVAIGPVLISNWFFAILHVKSFLQRLSVG